MAKEIDSMTMEEVMAATMTETRRVMQLHEEVRRVHQENQQLRMRICKRRAPVPPPVATPVAPAAAPAGAAGAQAQAPPAPKPKKLAPPTPDSETPRGGSEMVSVFNEYLQVNHAAFPEPTIEKADGLVKMTLKLNFNGQLFEATATCTNRKICKQVASEKLFEKIVPDVDVHASLQPVRIKIEEKRSRLKLVRAEKERNRRGEKRPWEGAANNTAKRANLGGMGGQMGGRGRGMMGGGYNAPSTTNNWQQPQQTQQPDQLNQQLGLTASAFGVGAGAGGSAWGGQASTTAASTNNWGMMQQQQQPEPAQQQAKTQTAEEQASILEEARKKGWAWDGSQWVPANQPAAQPAAPTTQNFQLPGVTGFGVPGF